MATNSVKMWVAPEFKKAMKSIALDKNKSVIAITKELSRDSDFDQLRTNMNGWKRKNEKSIFRQ